MIEVVSVYANGTEVGRARDELAGKEEGVTTSRLVR